MIICQKTQAIRFAAYCFLLNHLMREIYKAVAAQQTKILYMNRGRDCSVSFHFFFWGGGGGEGVGWKGHR